MLLDSQARIGPELFVAIGNFPILPMRNLILSMSNKSPFILRYLGKIFLHRSCFCLWSSTKYSKMYELMCDLSDDSDLQNM